MLQDAYERVVDAVHVLQGGLDSYNADLGFVKRRANLLGVDHQHVEEILIASQSKLGFDYVDAAVREGTGQLRVERPGPLHGAAGRARLQREADELAARIEAKKITIRWTSPVTVAGKHYQPGDTALLAPTSAEHAVSRNEAVYA